MTRKLLPYEHDLVDALGITKEEYLEFVALQQTYKDIKEGTVLDIRNDPVITAIVLTVIGLLFQVVSALLMPKFNLGGGERQTREQRFSPRFGFNSAQELAKYGDPVPLVYTNTSDNTAGGVRLAASLLWSAVRSYGSSQFLQMLMLLSGGGVTAINYAKSAFGQTTISNLISQNNWLYFEPGGTGTLAWSNEVESNGDTDPTRYGLTSNNPYCIQPAVDNKRVDGFSQAYSPSSATNCGVYSPVPLNVNLYLRNEAGNKSGINAGITASVQGWASGSLKRIAIDSTMSITFASTKGIPTDSSFKSDLERQAAETRRTLASVFDDSGIFKLGSATFQVTKVTGTSTDEDKVVVDLKCITAGHSPVLEYTDDEVRDTANEYKNLPQFLQTKATVEGLLSKDGRNSLYTKRSSPKIGVGSGSGTTANAGTDTLPNDQKIDITDAASLIKSKKIYKLERYKVKYQVTDYRYVFVRDLTAAELSDCRIYIDLQAGASSGSDDLYYLKVIGRYEEATYSTVSACNIADIALKASVFRRISGRQEKYGSERRAGYAISDNGICHRTSLFLLRYRNSEATSWEKADVVPGIFAIRRAADNDNFVYIKFNGGATAANWQFKLQPIIDPVAESRTNTDIVDSETGLINYFYLQNSGEADTIELSDTASIYFTGFTRASSNAALPLPPLNESPNGTNEWDWFSLDADTQLQTSFERGPEIQITAVSEQITEKFTENLYKNLSLIGFNVFSGRNLRDMRSFTAFVTKGRPVRRLRTSGQDENNNKWGSAKYKYYSTKPIDTPDDPDIGPTCFAPDIFLDTVLDANDGIGKYAQVEGIDLKQLAETKRFCKTNKLFMDGVIADLQNWREFWVNTAPFSLLEFSRSGGRESLVPAVPYDSETGKIKTQIAVSALFNQGNILEDSYKEENLDYGSNVQDLIASVVYRSLDANGIFAVNRSVEVRRNDTTEVDAIRQTFDLSAFVTTKAQAILFAKLLCNTRRHVRTAIEFKTFPTTSPVAPGAFIYVDIGQNNWDEVRTGVIGPGGKLNMPIDNRVTNGSYEMLLYQTGRGVAKQPVSVSSGVATNLDEKYEGYLFVLGIPEANTRRVFRVNQVEMDEEGEVLVRATGYPCDSSGNSKIADFTGFCIDDDCEVTS